MFRFVRKFSMRLLRFCTLSILCCTRGQSGEAFTLSHFSRLIKPSIALVGVKWKTSRHYMSMTEQSEPANDVAKWELMYE